MATVYYLPAADTLLLLCRLENGLHKLHKTQSEVDVLVENARAMAIEVEQKVANANVFAEQVMLPWGVCSCCVAWQACLCTCSASAGEIACLLYMRYPQPV